MSHKVRIDLLVTGFRQKLQKNACIIRTAATNSVALLSIYEYQFHALGTKKCHIPKPIEALLPIITNILTSKFIVRFPGNSLVGSTSEFTRQVGELGAFAAYNCYEDS